MRKHWHPQKTAAVAEMPFIGLIMAETVHALQVWGALIWAHPDRGCPAAVVHEGQLPKGAVFLIFEEQALIVP